MQHATAIERPDNHHAADLAAMSFLARYSGNTLDTYRLDMRFWYQWCADRGLDPIHAHRAHIETFARWMETERGNAPASVRRRLTVLRTFYAMLEDDEVIRRSPARNVRMPKLHRDDSRVLLMDRHDLGRFIATARHLSPRHHALAALLGLLALRVSEACAVQIEDFAETIRGHRVLHLVGKGAKPATIPLTVPVQRALDDAAGERTSGQLLHTEAGNPLHRWAAYTMVKRVGKAAGLSYEVHPHQLRHAAITNALDAGVSLRDAQIFARHSDPRTTAIYDRARGNLDRHAVHTLSAYIAA